MGYHLKLYSISKTDFDNFNFFYVKELSDMAYDELYKRFKEVSTYEFELADFLPFEAKFKTDLGNGYIISEEELKSFIKVYCEKQIEYLKSIYEEKDEKYQYFRMMEYFRYKIFDTEQWEDNLCLDKNKNRLTNNWRYETDVIDIVRIYKTFDFENNMLICIGS